MTTGARSPVVGYNTGVQYGGKTYHIQTEDSGRGHPHVITHLFADGGRVLATRRTSYAPYVGTERCSAMVKEIVLAQHKAMFVALRDGNYDAILAAAPGAAARHEEPALDLGEIERALTRANHPSREPERAAPVKATSVRASPAADRTARTSAPRIPITDAPEPTIDELILGELAALLADTDER
jgi:hypothetical protein